MNNKIIIKMEDILQAIEYRKYINSLDLKNIKLTEGDIVIYISKEKIDEFGFTGLSNFDFFSGRFFK